MTRLEGDPAEIAAHILNWFEPAEGMVPGSFTTNLLRAISSADLDNRARLALGFPRHVQMFILAQETVGGLDYLRALASDS